MTTRRYDSGTVWEREIGYSRAVRRGPLVQVSGTTAGDGDAVVGEGDAGEQARYAFGKIGRALAAVGASFGDVTRTRMYIVDAADAAAVTAAHAEVFAEVRPCASLMVVRGFIDARLLVEIEVDAYCED